MKRKLYISVIILLLLIGVIGTGSGEFRESRVYSIFEDGREDEFVGELEIVNDSALREFADEQDLKGNGTKKEPYLLENYTIDGSEEGYGLYLSNIDLHFVVKNTKIYNTSQAGVGLFQVSNFTLEGCFLENTEIGVWLEDSSKNEILNSQFNQSQTEGIRIKGSSPNNLLSNNEFEGCGIVIEGEELTMRGQKISNNTIDGDPLYYFKNQVIKNLTGNVGQMIIVNSSGSSQKDIGPLRIDSGTVGLIIAYSESISVENVTIEGQKKQGLHTIGSENIELKNSTVRENQGDGISLSSSTRLKIEENEIFLNERTGIYASSISDSKFKGNHIKSNGERGIDIDTPKSEMSSSSQPAPSENNTVLKNLIERSGGYGIHLSGNSFDNEISLNAVISNRLKSQYQASSEENQAFEDLYNTTLSNHWNSEEKLGNYWGEWGGVDEDKNGIIDSPYHIEGSDSKDNYPLSSSIGPPENVRASPRDGAVRLNWNEPRYSLFGSREKIEIYKGKMEGNVSFYKSVEGKSRGYLDENVTNNDTYYYGFRASFKENLSVMTEPIEAAPDGTSPTIIGYQPSGENISVNTVIKVGFSEIMKEGSVNISIDGVSGELVGEKDEYRFKPSENLSYGTTYHVNVTGEDTAGNLLEGQRSWSFTTISTVTVQGRIIDKDGEPIEGVLLDPDKGTQNITDSKGKFEIKLEPGSRSVRISKPGYVEKEVTFEVGAEELGVEKTIEDIELEKEKPTIEESNWFLPLVIIATGMFLLGLVAAVLFFLDWGVEETPSEEEIYEENYEDVSQEEFESWWNEED